MAIKILQSNQVTFVDTTDSRKLEVYLASNLPTVQIYNVNTGVYSPDWSVGEKLKLTASIFLDSKGISPTTIRWYKQIGTAVKTQLTTTSASLTISTNEMTGDASAIIIYSCEVEYQGLKASSQITFTRTDTGRDGKNGEDARVIALYSEDEVTWTDLTETPNPKYIKFSYDNGVHWATPIRIAGEDGSSIVIKGTATSRSLVADTDYYTLVYAGTTISNAELGDSYLFSGDLYVCASKQNGVDYFINVGKVQGPQGAPGESSYLFVRYAKDENGDGMVSTPTNETRWIATYVSDKNAPPTQAMADQLTWRKFVGEDGKDAKAIVLSGSSQIFKVNSGAITPTEITVTAQAINIDESKIAWEYSDNGGVSFTPDRPTGIGISGNVMTIPSSALTKDSLVIQAIDETGTYSDTYTVYKVSDGAQGTTGAPASMAFLTNENISFSANANGQVKATTFTTNVVAYTGTTKVTPVVGTPTGLPTGVTFSSSTTSNEVVLSFSIPDNSTLGSLTSTNGAITIPITSPVNTSLKLNWSKINTGADGIGIDSIQVKYGTTSSATVKPADDKWSDAIPTVPDGHYLWTRTITDYTDPSKDSTVVYTYAKQGEQGTQGVAGTSVTVKSIQYKEETSATATTEGTWSDYVVPVAEGRYLWTKTTFSDGKVAYGVAKQGNTGRGISKITEYYLASTASSGVTTATSGWTTAIQTIDSSKRYLWNYEIVTYTDNTTSSTTPIIIGVFGGTGATGKGVKSITEYYLASASSSGVTTSTSGWTTTMQTLTATEKYLWNYELITYTDNTTTTIAPVIIGAYGDIGPTGATGDAAVTFQVYSSNGYALSINTPIITLQTFAYIGDVEITSGATYQWYSYDDGWNVISGATLSYIDISRDSVSLNRSYMCKMTFGGIEYTDVATIDDKSDENKVFTTKPTSYSAGDLWIVGADYAPVGIEVGTLLKAEHTSSVYADSDWTLATKYDDRIEEIKNEVDMYNQYFSFTSDNGVRISARDANGVESQFSTSLTNKQLSFNYGDEAIAYIDGTKMNIKEAEIESPLTVTGKYSGSTMLQAPIINIGNFSIVVESNNSLSIIANT